MGHVGPRKIGGLNGEVHRTVFGLFDGRTGARRFERGFRVIVNKIEQSRLFLRSARRSLPLPSGRIAFMIVDDHGDSIRPPVSVTRVIQYGRRFSCHLFKNDLRTIDATLVEDSKKDGNVERQPSLNMEDERFTLWMITGFRGKSLLEENVHWISIANGS